MSIRITYIGASWCKVCVTVKPEVEKITGGFNIPLTVLDVDDGVDIKKVPTVRIYRDDVLVKEIVTGHVAALMETLIGLQE